LRKFKNGYVQALQYLFPDVKFNPDSFAKSMDTHTVLFSVVLVKKEDGAGKWKEKK
jgi:hypothetical protein